jgi:adenylate cyclase
VEERLPRRLAATLYADVAGYSRLTGQDEDSTHHRLSEYLDLISSAVESHSGQVGRGEVTTRSQTLIWIKFT